MRLRVEDLELSAGAFRLGPLSLEAGDGEYLIVLGPTGAGKTLTLEAIAGLRRPSAGRILMDSRDITASAPESRRIGFLHQESLLFPHLSVRANLEYGAHRIARAERTATIARLAAMLEIEALLDRMPRGLSGGERQRVALARALATDPMLLLLDEPMAALDPNSRHALRERLRAMHRELGTTTIHVTHSFSEALALGDRVAILIDGAVMQSGAPREVFSKPASAIISRFLKTASITLEANPPDPAEIRLELCVRGLALVAEPDGAGSAALIAEGAELRDAGAAPPGPDAIAARVIAIEAESDGGALALTLAAGLELRARVAAPGAGAQALFEGASVWVRIPRQ
ncbi:MAG TPA: ATP-binding cassette domain-containing protein [Candidatus Binataceae bacterium]|nr:ATP-binding cassette domain-containing protein [Candidatus Binataceae bacterium]